MEYDKGCPLSPFLFNLYINDDIHNWQMQLSGYFMIGKFAVDKVLFDNDQAIPSTSKSGFAGGCILTTLNLQRFSTTDSTWKTKVLLLQGADRKLIKSGLGGSYCFGVG